MGAKLHQSCVTLQPYGPTVACQAPPPGMNTGVSCKALLQGIFPIQGLNPHLSLSFFFLSSTSLLLPTHLPPLSCTHAQSCNPLGFSPPDSSVHGLFQARILEWVAISFSRTHISYISFFGFFSAPWEAPFKTKFFQVFKQNEKQPIQSQ